MLRDAINVVENQSKDFLLVKFDDNTNKTTVGILPLLTFKSGGKHWALLDVIQHHLTFERLKSEEPSQTLEKVGSTWFEVES